MLDPWGLQSLVLKFSVMLLDVMLFAPPTPLPLGRPRTYFSRGRFQEEDGVSGLSNHFSPFWVSQIQLEGGKGDRRESEMMGFPVLYREFWKPCQLFKCFLFVLYKELVGSLKLTADNFS